MSIRSFLSTVFFVFAISASVLSNLLYADVINVLMLDYDTRAGFGNGVRYQTALDDLRDTSNFGDAGTVNRKLNVLTPVSSLAGVDLTDVGLVIVAHSHQRSLATNDFDAIVNHVNVNGASVLALGRSFSDVSGGGGLSETMTSQFTNDGTFTSYKFPDTGNNRGRVVVNSSGANEITDGPFGNLRGGIVHSFGNQYWTGTTSGSTGTFSATFEDLNSHKFTDGLYGNYGNGRYMFVGGANMFGDADYGFAVEASEYSDLNNQKYFLNSINYLTEGTITAVPEPGSLSMLGFGVLCLISRRFYMRRRLRQINSD